MQISVWLTDGYFQIKWFNQLSPSAQPKLSCATLPSYILSNSPHKNNKNKNNNPQKPIRKGCTRSLIHGVSDPTFFLMKHFFTNNFFLPQISFRPTKNFGPKFFSYPKFFWTQYFWNPTFFSDPKYFSNPKLFSGPNFLQN